MGRVNSSIVEAICKKKLSEPSIQNKISKVQRKAIISGKKPNDISEIKMLQAGNQLLQTILNHFPTSLSKLKPELSTSVSEIKTSDGYYRIDIEFPEDVIRRKSLYPEKYEVIDNIISLFNNGYQAKNTVYGYWATAGKRVTSISSRPSLAFMQDAINNFNMIYANQYSCHAELGKQYKRE